MAIRRIDAMKGVEEMLPIIQEETPDTGGASGSGHDAMKAPIPEEETPLMQRSIREMAESHLPEAKIQRQHVLAGHLGHAPWCEICVQARGRDDSHTTICT